MLCNINTCICKDNSSQSTNSEQNLKSQSKKHRCCLPQTSTIQSSKPTENFNSCGYSNNHCCTCKVCTSIHIKTYGVHVMSPYQKSKNCNSTHSINHSNITKNRLTCKEAKYMTYNTKSRQNLNINFRMPKKPNTDIETFFLLFFQQKKPRNFNEFLKQIKIFVNFFTNSNRLYIKQKSNLFLQKVCENFLQKNSFHP